MPRYAKILSNGRKYGTNSKAIQILIAFLWVQGAEVVDVELVEMSAVKNRSTCQGYAVVGKLVRHKGDMFTCTAAEQHVQLQSQDWFVVGNHSDACQAQHTTSIN